MIQEVCEALKQNLSTLPFLTKVGGLVTVINQDKKKFPAVRSEGFGDYVGDYIDMLPSRDDVGVAFFEQLTNTITERNMHRSKHRATVNLVVWYNSKLINPKSDSLIEAHIIKKVLTPNFSNLPTYIKNVKVEIVTNSDYSNPFSKYTLNDEQMQYRIYPYQSFSMVIGIDYFFIDSCLPTISVENVTECQA